MKTPHIVVVGSSKEVTERRHAAQPDDGTILELAVGLRKLRDGNVALGHGRKSAVAYAGLASL